VKPTFAKQLGQLAESCNIALVERAGQVESWVNEFGKDVDEVINHAFAILRADGGFKGSWPTYPEIKKAFSLARNAAAAIAKAAKDRADKAACESTTARRLSLAFLYARFARGQDAAEVQKGVELILSPDVSDATVARFLKKNRIAFALPGQQSDVKG